MSRSVVMNLMILNAIVFLAQTVLPQGMGGERMVDMFGLHFWGAKDFRLYQVVTYMFLHGNFSHLFFNMFALWMFGRILEYDLGSKRFLIFYMVCGIGAALCNMGVNFLTIEFSGDMMQKAAAFYGKTIGASGAVFGVLLAFGVMHPNDRIMLLIPPIPMKAKYFVIIYGLLEFFLGVTDTGSNIAHFAHVGGMLFGWMLLIYWKRKNKIYY